MQVGPPREKKCAQLESKLRQACSLLKGALGKEAKGYVNKELATFLRVRAWIGFLICQFIFITLAARAPNLLEE